MDTACKWSTIGILWIAFFGVVTLSGCIHIIEFMGALLVSIVAARWFYRHLCNRSPPHLAGQQQATDHLPSGTVAAPAVSVSPASTARFAAARATAARSEQTCPCRRIRP